jgi:hypothetical protein
MTKTRTLIDRLKGRAGAMARPFIGAAEQPDASEIARAFGEAAQLRDAEAPARQLPRAEFERRVDAQSYALAAWIRATEDLLTLGRPSAYIYTQESPARH